MDDWNHGLILGRGQIFFTFPKHLYQGSFAGGKMAGAWSWPLIMPRLRIHGGIHPLPSCVFMTCRETALPFTLLSILCDIISSKDYRKVPKTSLVEKTEYLDIYKNLKHLKETSKYYYILGKYWFNTLQVVQLFHTNGCKIWPTVLVKGFCKLAAEFVSENSKLHELIRKRSSYTIPTVLNDFKSQPNTFYFNKVYSHIYRAFDKSLCS